MILRGHAKFPQFPRKIVGIVCVLPKNFDFLKKLFSRFFLFFLFSFLVRTPPFFFKKKIFNHKSTGYELFFAHTSKKEEKRPKSEKKRKKSEKKTKKIQKKFFPKIKFFGPHTHIPTKKRGNCLKKTCAVSVMSHSPPQSLCVRLVKVPQKIVGAPANTNTHRTKKSMT
jgi:hypothetical protein